MSAPALEAPGLVITVSAPSLSLLSERAIAAAAALACDRAKDSSAIAPSLERKPVHRTCLAPL